MTHPPVSTVVSYPGVMDHAQQVALAFHDAGELRAYVTTLAFHGDDPLMRWLESRPGAAAQRALRELRRREITTVPRERLVRYPTWEALRTLASRARLSPPLVDRLWDHMSLAFDRTVADRHVAPAQRVYAFEYTALATFERARALGLRTILDLPSLDTLELHRQLEREWAEHPDQRPADQAYFDAKLARRYERRQREIALADVLIANSRLTARSHIQAGADPTRVRVVPLGARPPVPSVIMPPLDGPLNVIWASGVTFRKGAHHFFEAWRRLGAGAHAAAHMYGGQQLPASLAGQVPPGLTYHGAVAQAQLFEELARSDVLVFPTLSDGFGMVVSEALAHGVPVIVSDRAGAADLIAHGRNGFVFPAGDVDALHRLLQWCLDERKALSAMRTAAWESAARWQWSDYRQAIREACA